MQNLSLECMNSKLKHLNMQIEKNRAILEELEEKVDRQECFLKGLESAHAILVADYSDLNND